MTPLLTNENLRVERRAGWTFHLTPGVSADDVLAALHTAGGVLKESRKSITRRTGPWVIKESRAQSGLGLLKHTLQRNRYRQAWIAALYLTKKGLRVPRPIAFAEHSLYPLIFGNVIVCEYLDGFENVEAVAKRMAEQRADAAAVRSYFAGLADAVNALCAANAYHADLSGKNIFTRDGRAFYFIDLDGVIIARPYTDALRLKNHIQLHDSFCDWFDDACLTDFIARMLPEGANIAAWMTAVLDGQRKRRARTVAIWKKQGRM